MNLETEDGASFWVTNFTHRLLGNVIFCISDVILELNSNAVYMYLKGSVQCFRNILC